MNPELELLFLGTGTSVGIPMIGCHCAVCTSEDPRDKRDRCSVFMRSPELAWVIDTGPEFRHQCLRAGISHLDAVLYTHEHTDHVMGFDDLRRFTYGEQASLPVHGNASVLSALRRAFAFAFDGTNRPAGYFKPAPREVKGPFHLGKTEVTPLPVVHGGAETNGYLFSRGGNKLVGYIPDVKQIPQETLRRLQGVDTFIVDCLRERPLPTHFSVEEALAAVEAVAPRRAFFTHLCHELGHASFEITLPSHIRVAYDGLRLQWP